MSCLCVQFPIGYSSIRLTVLSKLSMAVADPVRGYFCPCSQSSGFVLVSTLPPWDRNTEPQPASPGKSPGGSTPITGRHMEKRGKSILHWLRSGHETKCWLMRGGQSLSGDSGKIFLILKKDTWEKKAFSCFGTLSKLKDNPGATDTLWNHEGKQPYDEADDKMAERWRFLGLCRHEGVFQPPKALCPLSFSSGLPVWNNTFP